MILDGRRAFLKRICVWAVIGLAAPLACRGQASPHPAAPPLPAPAAAVLGELQRQVEALNAELLEMRAEVTGARSEATALRQELGDTRDELTALKKDLAATRSQAVAQAAAAVPPPASSQAPGSATQHRLSKLEEDEQLLSQQVKDQDQTKVESGSKYRVRLSGMALLNAFSTRGAVDNFDVPGSATARDSLQPNGAFGATLRQSILGLDVSGPEVFGAQTSADIRADFAGGFAMAPNGVTSGVVRLRTAGLRLDWQNTSVIAGQYAPFFSPLSPSSLATMAYPALATSGNLWVWTPQVYVEHRIGLSEGSSITVQGGILDPLTGEPPASGYRYPQAGERAGQPAYAARLAWADKTPAGPLSVGFGGYYENQDWGYGRRVAGWAATADWSVPLSHWLAFTGEFYHGRALGGLGGGDGVSVAMTGSPYDPATLVRGLNSTGGWAQLKFIASERLEFNGAFGEDFSNPPALGYSYAGVNYTGAMIGRNESGYINTIYRLRSNLLFSLEYRRLRTAETQPGVFNANQVSLSAATLF